MVPEAQQAMDNMKFEIARELGVNLKQGYNGDLSSRENGYVGGYMVKRMIQQAENQMAGKQ
ncbi:MAG: alpha/beta-type small acid-soluble spore protein [Clostridia bacterium]|nr:alpha/beta-type small acid-soluble spore protein [Clostridia bacterium]